MTSAASRGSRPELADPPSGRDESIPLLAPALGEEKAREIVLATAHHLGISGAEWTRDAMRALFDHIAKEPGLVGITARVVTRRLRMGGHPASLFDAHVTATAPAPPTPAPLPTVESAAAATAAKPWESVSDLLAQALGEPRARSTVESAVYSLGLGRSLSFTDALRVLEHVAREPGVVGIAARFAKTRLHLLSW